MAANSGLNPRKREREWTGQQLRSPGLTGVPLDQLPPPADWPESFPPPTGPIDAAKFDMPQTLSSLEWWYFNCHLTSKKTGGAFSVFSSFFRQADFSSITEEEALQGKPYEFYDACTWAVVDVANKRYIADSALDHQACAILEAKLDPKVANRKMSHAEIALREMCKEGRLPRPDRALKRPSQVAKTGSLSINLDNECVVTSEPYSAAKHGPRFGTTIPGTTTPLSATAIAANKEAEKIAHNLVYHVQLHNPNRQVSADLTFVPQRPIVRHGAHGIVNHMFYYYCPRMAVKGTITFHKTGEKHEVEGNGWYDREFGGKRSSEGKDALDAWTWFSLQLSDNSEFTLFNIVDKDTQLEKEKVAVLSDATGKRIPINDVQISYSTMWTSMCTYMEYPMQWKLLCPSIGLELHVDCAIEHQEFGTVLVHGGGFYEGRVNVTGSHNGNAITGTGFIERKNHTTFNDTDGLLKSVGRFVKQKLAEMYPLDAPKEWIDKYVLGRHATPGTDPKRVCDTLFKPVRSLTDRGGKSWRSLILVSCMNALSEEYIDCSRYIALSELLHVGSLIIDDIQDESVVRRGGKCVHLDYGVATAINSGCGCFFMAPALSNVEEHTPEVQLQLYHLYFDVLRAGHAGQGLDIAGLDPLMPHAVETGDTKALLDSLRAIHIYKTGGAAGTLCRMACVLTTATPAQADALENFGLQVGLAFQIVDDALNLRGFEGDLKEVGEDIRDGKVTYPVIKALSRLSKTDRVYVWTTLQEHTSDRGKVQSVIDKLNSVGAVEDCLVEARELIETAWEPVNKLLADSLPKIMMRAFCSYLTERTF